MVCNISKDVGPCHLSLPQQLSFVFAEFPMRLVLNDYLHESNHILCNVKTCGKYTRHLASTDEWLHTNNHRITVYEDSLQY